MLRLTEIIRILVRIYPTKLYVSPECNFLYKNIVRIYSRWENTSLTSLAELKTTNFAGKTLRKYFPAKLEKCLKFQPITSSKKTVRQTTAPPSKTQKFNFSQYSFSTAQSLTKTEKPCFSIDKFKNLNAAWRKVRVDSLFIDHKTIIL